MKNLFKILAAALVAFAAVSCSEPGLHADADKMDVTPTNIAGEWKLVSYDSGVKPAEGSYLYLDIRRKDRVFTEFKNLDNHYGTAMSGRYYIYEDEVHGAVIRGEYDYSLGQWNHYYKVTLYNGGTMVWTALDDDTAVCVYERCEIPEDVRALDTRDENDK